MRRTLRLASFAATLVAGAALAQDARELQAEKARNARLAGPHPLAALMESRSPALLPELKGVHPRVYFTDRELQQLRVRAQSTHRELWQQILGKARALNVEAPPAPAQERRAQNEVGIGIAEAAFAYKVQGDPQLLAAAKKYMDAAESYDVWGYKNNKPDVDLAAGHLLYGLGWGYDLLYHELNDSERERYRKKLVRQGRLMYEYFKPKAGKTYAYSQNHTFIPIAGLAVAAYALYDEVDEARDWAALARAIFDRVLATYSTDGYYYEGFEYWIFSTPWLIHYLDAHAHATGEDLFDRPGLRLMPKYVAHAMLPGGGDAFDFGDQWAGPETRAKGEEYERSHPDGHFASNYNLLYRLAGRFRDAEAQGVADWLKGLGQVNAEDFWSLAWYDPGLLGVPIEKQQAWHYFPDHELVYWRSDWNADATAIAFKCGPPEGHHTAALLEQFPDWRLSAGHAHPDAGSFIVFANGEYLTGDSGYAGVPLTVHHNTVLVGGRGQGLEGKGHDPWDGVPYARLNQTKITEVKATGSSLRIRGDATASYMPELGLTGFTRRFEYTKQGGLTITDSLKAAKPVVFTSLVHADRKVDVKDERHFLIDAPAASLTIELVAPNSAKASIEPNEMVGQGPPGSVDKGKHVVRGERLAVSTGPAAAAQLVLRLRWQAKAPSE